MCATRVSAVTPIRCKDGVDSGWPLLLAAPSSGGAVRKLHENFAGHVGCVVARAQRTGFGQA
jgi:hypothetical protein